MKRPVNHNIFFFLNLLFNAEKKLRRRIRRDLVAGRITKTDFEFKTMAASRAFDRRYFALYRKFA